MRKRVTITIRDNILRELDKLVNGLSIRSRSHAVEYLLSKTFEGYKISGALVLAGGYDKIGNLPKCAAGFSGKSIVSHALNFLASKGVGKSVIYTDYMQDKLKGAIVSPDGMELVFFENENPVGRALPIKEARKFFNSTFLVYYGDTLCNFDLNDMIRFHKDNKAIATIALTTSSNPSRYGVVKMKGNKITEFIEKPMGVGSYLVSSGIFLIEPDILNIIKSSSKSVEEDLFPRLAKKGVLCGYPFEGLWLNINTKKDLERAKILWKDY